MADRREELERITARDARPLRRQRRGVLGGHARPRREPEHRGAAAPHRGHAAVRDPRPRLRPRPRPRHLPRPRPRGGRPRRRGRGSSRWRAPTPAARSGSRTSSRSTCPPRASTASSPMPSLFHVPAQELPRVLRRAARDAASRAACCSARIRAATARKAGTAAATASTTSSTAGGATCAAAGFVELEHYYRPDGPAARAAAVAGERLAARRRFAALSSSGCADAGHAGARQHVERAVDAHQQIDRRAPKAGRTYTPHCRLRSRAGRRTCRGNRRSSTGLGSPRGTDRSPDRKRRRRPRSR